MRLITRFKTWSSGRSTDGAPREPWSNATAVRHSPSPHAEPPAVSVGWITHPFSEEYSTLARRIRSIIPGAICSPAHPQGVPREDDEEVRDAESRRETLRRRGINPRASWCKHDNPILVSSTETGSYYARCLVCLETGPQRLDSEAARQAILVLGPSTDSRYNRIGG